MEEAKEKHVNSASGSTVKSKLRYPLRSALKSKEGKPPAPEFSSSSGSRRGRSGSTVSQSTTALDLSAKDDKSVKPPRRLSIPSKSLGNSASKSLSNITPISETRAMRSNNARGKVETPASSTMRSSTRRNVDDLSKATYWLSQIKLSESAAKHSISLGFFRLAQQSGCEPFQQMREALKSYASRNNLDDLKDAVKELCELYNISEEPAQRQVSENCSVVPEETTVSVHSSSSAIGDLNVTPESDRNEDDASQASFIARTTKKEDSQKSIPKGTTQTRRSLTVSAGTPKCVSGDQDSEDGTRSSRDGLQSVPQTSSAKRTAKKETFPKNNPDPPARARKSLTNSSANSRMLSESQGDRSQKKTERITRPRTKANQEEKKDRIKKQEKKADCKEGGQVATPEEASSMENKENSVAPTTEEIQVE